MARREERPKFQSIANSILVRSNYKQPEVVLRIELLQGSVVCGHADVQLLTSTATASLPAKTTTLNFNEQMRATLDVAAPAAKLALLAECASAMHFNDWRS